jgi:Zn finger protein HypA/HybF involved in hydrogenase expression
LHYRQQFERQPFSFACPHCGGEGRPTAVVTEFYVEYIEVEKTEEETDGRNGKD